MFKGGYKGKILFVDLSKKEAKVHELSEEEAYKYIGGSGLGALYLNRLSGPETDPLGSDNPLIFMTGPLTGTKVPLSGRHQVITRSPLTGILGEADAGGYWGAMLKRAGFDGVIVAGASEKPVYLWVHDGSVEIRDASHIWGLDTYEADEAIRKETDSKMVAACIGPAGEKRVLIAGIMHDGRDARAAARCGVGAVMGSKSLKAIAVYGEEPISVADEDGLNKSLKEMGPIIVKEGKGLGKYGTAGAIVTIEKVGDLPVKNWVEGKFEGVEKISGQKMVESILTGRFYCASCLVGCGRKVRVASGRYAPVDGAGPEYESLAMLGALNLVDNLEALAKATELCNRYGLDTISTGAVIGFAIEAFERGLLTEEDTNGVKLKWGDPDIVIRLVEEIGEAKGLGRLLGLGVKRISEKLGGLACELAIHVKGLEFPAHDPRAYNSLGLAYATSNRGACHLQGFTHVFERSLTMPDLGFDEVQDRFGIEGKGELVAKLQDLMCLYDSLKICKFTLFAGVKLRHILQWFNLVTGWGVDLVHFMKTGERIFNLKRMYNVRMGISRKDDTLPPRILTLKRGVGGAADNLPPLNYMLADYYRYRGWDEFGIPTVEKLEELGLTKEFQ